MKKILFLLYFLSIFANAEEIKLTCQANVKQTINGDLNSNIDGILEITILESFDKKLHSIITNGIASHSATSMPIENYYERFDSSNSNRWLVSSKINNLTENITESATMIEINRNTGSINIFENSTVLYEDKKYLVQRKTIGICSKVDTTKKKF